MLLARQLGERVLGEKHTINLASTLLRLVVIIGISLGVVYYISMWSGDNGPDAQGFTKTPYWDFNNLWTGGRLALEGHVDYIFNMDQYRPAMRRLLELNVPSQEWSYPPSLLLLAVPLGALPALPAYIVWTLGSVLLLHLAIRPYKFPLTFHLAVLLSPAVFINAMFGQNGSFISALFIMGLYYIPKKPVLAGICFGLMTVKPHLGILIPFLLLARGQWKVIFSAGITTIGMAVLTGLLFGFSVWPDFLHNTQPMMQAFMEMPFPHPYQANTVTGFILARGFGANLPLAYLFQGGLTLAAILAVMMIWRSESMHDDRKIALTLGLALVATPYGYIYDMVGMSFAVALIVYITRPSPWWAVLAVLWVFPIHNHHLILNVHKNFGILVILASLWVMWTLPERENASAPVSSPAVS